MLTPSGGDQFLIQDVGEDFVKVRQVHGLVRYPSMPGLETSFPVLGRSVGGQAHHRDMVFGIAPPSSRMASVACSPSMTGIWTSMRTRSKSVFLKCLHAQFPVGGHHHLVAPLFQVPLRRIGC